jgi:hypothetical protein
MAGSSTYGDGDIGTKIFGGMKLDGPRSIGVTKFGMF